MPGTWKSVYRLLSGHGRLNFFSSAKYYDDLGIPPRNYWDGNRIEWYYRVREELDKYGYPDAKGEKLLEDVFGIRSVCFWGEGKGPNFSRIFFSLNLHLTDIRHWIVNLGKPTDGNIIN